MNYEEKYKKYKKKYINIKGGTIIQEYVIFEYIEQQGIIKKIITQEIQPYLHTFLDNSHTQHKILYIFLLEKQSIRDLDYQSISGEFSRLIGKLTFGGFLKEYKTLYGTQTLFKLEYPTMHLISIIDNMEKLTAYIYDAITAHYEKIENQTADIEDTNALHGEIIRKTSEHQNAYFNIFYNGQNVEKVIKVAEIKGQHNDDDGQHIYNYNINHNRYDIN